MKDHIWYAILPNKGNYVEDIGVGINSRHEHIITVLCNLGYLNYKKDKLIFIKNKWNSINAILNVPGGLQVTYTRGPNKVKLLFLCNNIPTYSGPSQQIKAKKVEKNITQEISFRITTIHAYVISCDHITKLYI